MDEKERVIGIICKQIFDYSERASHPFHSEGTAERLHQRSIGCTEILLKLYPDEFPFQCDPLGTFDKAIEIGKDFIEP